MDAQPKTWTDTLEQWSKIAGTLAIPVVLGVVGYFIQLRIADQSTQKDFLLLAINILKEDPAKVSPDVRAWAVKVFERASPVKPPKEVTKDLNFGSVWVIPGPLPKMPPDVLVPPKPFVKLDVEKMIAAIEKNKAAVDERKVLYETVNALVKNYFANLNVHLENEMRLNLLQKFWNETYALSQERVKKFDEMTKK